MSALRLARTGTSALLTSKAPTRLFSVALRRRAEGDTGGVRSSGQRAGDGWTRREKAAEDMYIKEREKAIVLLLKEKIAKQEEQLIKDRALLVAMEDQYGNVVQA